ncbi:hypothetical protein Cs7R123_32050 [Catellatospora sp. TT07R-123]|uniref:DUF4192 domain-containing protein n=1 Tax=Catellatospora sp. TT07R-123 TaxID=2733863 RepID=UPI001B2ACF4E|nr:DUF4192 domain-containing protein [Catellatospora sp. TT07R-123]GHJ45863.1 hypothetical protein Cs7R123_32050 [Catellatospora sp. TT07R-123]
MPVDTPTFHLRTPEDMFGTVPYLLGYHPTDSLVVLYLQDDQRVHLFTRHDLADHPDAIAGHVRALAHKRGATRVAVLAYGPPSAIDRVRATVAQLDARLRVADVYLLAEGRYYCLRCPACRAAKGLPLDPATTAAAAHATLRGLVALPSRQALVALTLPDQVARAETAEAIAVLRPRGDKPTAVLRFLLEEAADGHRLTTGQAALMAVMLTDIRLRDIAWQATTSLMWQRDLWLDLTRRTPDTHIAAPAALAAWCAWMRGEDLLAAAALNRVAAVDADYGMARLVAQGIGTGVPAREIVPQWPPTADDTLPARHGGEA